MAQKNGEELLAQPLKHLPGLWDPGRTKLLHVKTYTSYSGSAVMVQAPHRQNTVMSITKGSSDWEMLNLPLPYIYYFIRFEKYNGQLQMQVAGIGQSLSLKDLYSQGIQVLPLPNTGNALYTCSMPFYITEEIIIEKLFKDKKLNNILLREVCKAAILHFWQEGFHYLEHTCNAHKNLYQWGGASKDYTNGSAIDLKPYHKWETLKIPQLASMAWLGTNIHKDHVKAWLP